MSEDSDTRSVESQPPDDPEERYERPQVIDYGTLTELTLSGHAVMSDGLMTAGS